MKRFAIIVVILMLTVSGVQADQLFGVTATDLVRIDPANPAVVTTVGPHNLPLHISPTSLTYDPVQQQLVGVGYERSGATVINQYLVAFSLQTGQSTLLSTLGNPATVGFYEALEYNNTLNSLIASHETTFGSFKTNQLVRMATNGATSLQVLTTLAACRT